MCFFCCYFSFFADRPDPKTYDGYKVSKVTNLIKSSAQHYSLFGIIDCNLMTKMWRIDLWIDSLLPSSLSIIICICICIVNSSQCRYPFLSIMFFCRFRFFLFIIHWAAIRWVENFKSWLNQQQKMKTRKKTTFKVYNRQLKYRRRFNWIQSTQAWLDSAISHQWVNIHTIYRWRAKRKQKRKRKKNKMGKERQTHNQTTHVKCRCVDFIEAETAHGKWSWMLALIISSYTNKERRKEWK